MIVVDHRDSVARLRMEHGKANALDLELCRDLVREFRNLAQGPSRAVVLTGRGGIFSAGVDLLRVAAGGPDYIRRLLPALHEFCETIFSFPKPLVAAVNGHALAGGFILACMADRRIMARGSGRVGLPELLVGVPFPPGPMEVMRFALPSEHLARMMYGGATYEPEPAADLGLLEEVVEPAELQDQAWKSAQALGGLGYDTFRLTKSQIRHPALEQMRARQREIGPEIERVWTAPETLTRIGEYVQRTLHRAGRAEA